jgi:hypothetical protein
MTPRVSVLPDKAGAESEIGDKALDSSGRRARLSELANAVTPDAKTVMFDSVELAVLQHFWGILSEIKLALANLDASSG